MWAEGVLFCLGAPPFAYQASQRPAFLNLQTAIFAGLAYLFIAGVAGLAAAYGLWRNRGWAPAALRAASILNLGLVPLDAPTKPAGFKRPSRLGRIVVVVQILASLLLVPPITNYLKAQGSPTLSYVGFWACFPLAVLLGIVCHELGHVIAARTSGFRFQAMAAGPLVVSNLSDGWRVQWVNSTGLWNGLTVMAPRNPARLLSNAVFFVLGGPVGSLLCGSGSLALMLAGPELHLGRAAEFFGILGVIGLVNCVANLVPLEIPGGFNDGARLMHLIRKQPEGVRFLAELAFGLSNATTLRPKDWHPQWIQSMTEDPLAAGFSRGCYYAYVHHLDRGDVDEASMWLARSMDSHGALKPDPYRSILAIENAFFEARHLKNPDGAKVWMKAPRAGIPAERFTVLRVKAAIHVAEGERDLAHEAIEAALRLHAQSVATGRQQFERAVLRDVQNWFDELTGAGSLSRLAQALRERDSLVEVVKALQDHP